LNKDAHLFVRAQATDPIRQWFQFVRTFFDGSGSLGEMAPKFLLLARAPRVLSWEHGWKSAFTYGEHLQGPLEKQPVDGTRVSLKFAINQRIVGKRLDLGGVADLKQIDDSSNVSSLHVTIPMRILFKPENLFIAGNLGGKCLREVRLHFDLIAGRVGALCGIWAI
jgi:hypothetical protein